jgi:hypothetical protein
LAEDRVGEELDFCVRREDRVYRSAKALPAGQKQGLKGVDGLLVEPDHAQGSGGGKDHGQQVGEIGPE